MNTARQAPELSIRPGGGLANIRHLRKLVDWYQRLAEHREIVAQKIQKETTLRTVPAGPFDANTILHRGTMLIHQGGNVNDPANWRVEDNPASLQPQPPYDSRNRGGTGPAGTIYNLTGSQPPPASDRRIPYTLPRPRGLVLLREVKDFILWATRSTDPAPAPTGLATRDDLLKAAQSIAAAGNLAK